MFEFSNNNKKLITLAFFFFFLVIGILSYSDYGISIDEDNTRISGFVSLKYVLEIISLEKGLKLNEIINVPNINNYNEQGIGVIFDLPMACIEYFFKIDDAREYYLLRHLCNFLIYFLSVYFFYLIAKKRFDSNLMGILAATFIIISPRIFAESYYNNKDIIFMSLFIICLYTGINFLDKPNFLNSVLFSFTSALATDVRILGIILPILIILIYTIKVSRENVLKKDFIKILSTFIFFTMFFIILFWPYLWENPIKNFFIVLSNLSKFDVEIYNLYMGNYINAKSLPWHYTLVWQLITIPIVYLILFLMGFLLVVYRFVKRLKQIENEDFWRGNNELLDLIFLATYLIPIFLIIIFNSTLYDGWRHLYFIYPSFLLIALSGLNFLRIMYFKKIKKMFIFLSILFLLPTLTWMIKYHPHQYVYFNYFAGKNFNKSFEMDYWGLSYYHALNYIIENNNDSFYVTNVGTGDLTISKNFVKKELRNKVNLVDNEKNADYIINNYRDWTGKIKDFDLVIPSNFNVFYEIKVDGVSINTIYKKNE